MICLNHKDEMRKKVDKLKVYFEKGANIPKKVRVNVSK